MASRENFSRIFLDAISDGVDNGSHDALNFVEQIEQKFIRLNLGKFSSISGRYYAMDRDRDYKKTLKVYQALILGKAQEANDPISVLTSCYRQGLTDFMIPPTLTGLGKKVLIGKGDAIIFFNFRSDRAIQLTRVLSDHKFGIRFWRPKLPKNLYVATMTEYEKDLPVKIAFPPAFVPDILPAIFAKYQKEQLRIAETEKMAHVTSFFNCGQESFEKEDSKIILSRRVKDWSQAPEMSLELVTKTIIAAIKSDKYDFILANIANVDMMAHTGNISAAGRAVQAVDEATGKIVEANLKANGATIITADHGNVEQIVKFNPNRDPENKHTLNPVPFILITGDNRKTSITKEILPPPSSLAKLINIQVSLADVAPTILELMGLPKPTVMKGRSILGVLE
jgi:2,3-bisphosphoglycerate-independent phosphoglycerate mutase